MPANKLILSYDGTRYFGWQKTRMGPSIQQTLAEVLLRLTQEEIVPEAASRTDRGVHATGQTIHFTSTKSVTLRGLNALLPPDIRAIELKEVSPDFHATLHALGKEYRYQIDVGSVEDPFQRLYSWHVHTPLNLDKMKAAAKDLVGTHDFSAFANEPEENPICTLHSIEFEGSLLLRLKGDRFLYRMARNLVGTLIYIGSGKIASDAIPAILASKDRKKAGVTAPAHGLTLHEVFYTDALKLRAR